VTLKNSASNQAIDDSEVRRKFQQFGDVKAVRAPRSQRFVDFFDTRVRTLVLSSQFSSNSFLGNRLLMSRMIVCDTKVSKMGLWT